MTSDPARGVRELQQYVDELKSGMDELRSRLTAWSSAGAEDGDATGGGSQEPHAATCEGVTARSSLSAGLLDLGIDQRWLEDQELDDVAQCVVRAVNDSEAACRAAVWASLGDIKLGAVSIADLADPAAQERWRTSPTDFVASFVPSRQTKEHP